MGGEWVILEGVPYKRIFVKEIPIKINKKKSKLGIFRVKTSGWKFPSETYVEVSMKIYMETSGNLMETLRKFLTRCQILETSHVGFRISNIGFF